MGRHIFALGWESQGAVASILARIVGLLAKSVLWTMLTGRAAVPGSLCFPSKEVLVSGQRCRSRTAFARKLDIVSRLARFRREGFVGGDGRHTAQVTSQAP